MIKTEDIDVLLSPHKCRVLDFAQMALPESQFKAFRKLFLDELGHNGFLLELDRLLTRTSHSPERHGTGRQILRKKGGVP